MTSPPEHAQSSDIPPLPPGPVKQISHNAQPSKIQLDAARKCLNSLGFSRYADIANVSKTSPPIIIVTAKKPGHFVVLRVSDHCLHGGDKNGLYSTTTIGPTK